MRFSRFELYIYCEVARDAHFQVVDHSKKRSSALKLLFELLACLNQSRTKLDAPLITTQLRATKVKNNRSPTTSLLYPTLPQPHATLRALKHLFLYLKCHEDIQRHSATCYICLIAFSSVDYGSIVTLLHRFGLLWLSLKMCFVESNLCFMSVSID